MDNQLNLLEKLFENSQGAEEAFSTLIIMTRDMKYLHNLTYNLRGFFKKGDRRYNGLTEMMSDLDDSLELLGLFMYVYNKYHPKYAEDGGFFDVDQEYWKSLCRIKSNYIDNGSLVNSDIAAYANRIALTFRQLFIKHDMANTHKFLSNQYSRIQENLSNFAFTFKEMNNVV